MDRPLGVRLGASGALDGRLFPSVNQEVTITARHDGHLRLDVEVRGWERDADWKAEGAVVLDAGEQLRQAGG